MAESSATIPYKMAELLKKVDSDQILLTFGFVREINIALSIPDSIINFCIIFTFLKINEWYIGTTNRYEISDSKLIATLNSSKPRRYWSYATIFANPIISEGKHKWKIKLIQFGITDIYVGVTSNMHCLEHRKSYFYGITSPNAANGYSYAFTQFSGQSNKMDHTMGASQDYPDDYVLFTVGDIITVHLDLDKKTVGFSKNDEFMGIAFTNIEPASYRLAISGANRLQSVFELCD